MTCPSPETLHDLVDGELAPSERQETLNHVRSCPSCRPHVRQLIELSRALFAISAEETCPERPVLETYARGDCSTQEMKEVEEHVRLCPGCSDEVWLMTASDSELNAEFAANTRKARQLQAEELGLKLAAKSVQELLPDRIDLFQALWARVVGRVNQWLEQGIGQSPETQKREQFAGALQFVNEPDPEAFVVALITGTALLTANAICDERVKPPGVGGFTNMAAIKLGAGPALASRLAEVIAREAALQQ